MESSCLAAEGVSSAPTEAEQEAPELSQNPDAYRQKVLTPAVFLLPIGQTPARQTLGVPGTPATDLETK